jgi:hypothetical protein
VSTNPEPSPTQRPGRLSVDELFAAAQPIRSADDLAHDGIFDDDEIDEFLTDLYAMRRSDVA